VSGYTVFNDNLQAKEVIVGNGERRNRYILCYNPKEAKRQREHRQAVVALLEAELGSHPNTSAKAQWAIELLASRRLKRYVRVTKDNQIRIDRMAIREAAKYDGKWVLKTNDDTLHLADVQNLLKVLQNLVDEGNTIAVIEHNIEIIKAADYIIDLGPDGGDGGGQVIFAGSPVDLLARPTGSHTARFLEKYLANRTRS